MLKCPCFFFIYFLCWERNSFKEDENNWENHRLLSVLNSVLDPDPPGSEIIWPQGSGSGFEIIIFGSGSSSRSGYSPPIRILPFFTPNLKICFKNALESEKIHQNFIYISWKIQKVKNFNTFVPCYYPKLRTFFHDH